MGYHKIRLPETFSVGSLFGPGFKTQIVETDSGSESRLQRYPPAGRRRYNLSRGIDSIDSLTLLVEFFVARGGAENSFPVKDWLDYASTDSWTTHRDADDSVSALDILIGIGDGATTQFQLIKKYVSGPTTITRTIRKPVAGTVLVSLDDTPTASGWTVNDETGVVTFTVAPSVDVEIKAGFQFDVPCRFGEDTDEALQIAISAVEAGNLPEINVIEDLDPVTISQSRDLGGAYDHGAISANVQLSELNGRVQRVAPTTGGIRLLLPSPQESGGPYFAIVNASGSNSVLVRNQANTTTIVTIGVNTMVVIWLGYDGTTKNWYVT